MFQQIILSSITAANVLFIFAMLKEMLLAIDHPCKTHYSLHNIYDQLNLILSSTCKLIYGIYNDR